MSSVEANTTPVQPPPSSLKAFMLYFNVYCKKLYLNVQPTAASRDVCATGGSITPRCLEQLKMS